nr:MAG TPA: hypothetical protein [Caudoviricetes sp.]
MKLYTIRTKTNEGTTYDKGYTSREYAMEVAELQGESWDIIEREISYVYVLAYTKIGDKVERGTVEVYDGLDGCHSHMLEGYKRVAEESSTSVLEAWAEDTQAYYRTETYSIRWNIVVSDAVPVGCRKVKHIYGVTE